MQSKPAESLESIPQPLLRWIKSQAALPLSITKAKTFYEASRAAQAHHWQRRLDHVAALHSWSTLALIADERTRKYMAKLITDDTAGVRWTMDTGQSTLDAMDELQKAGTTPPGRLFEQRRDAAMRGLQAARENLALLDTDFALRELLKGPHVRKFRRFTEQFQMDALLSKGKKTSLARESAADAGASLGELFFVVFREMGKTRGDKVPLLSELLSTAALALSEFKAPKPDRHRARAKYLRNLFYGLENSAVKDRRMAFLTYASVAVFGERIEKRDLRRLIYNLVE